jgi:hypothetical protein
MLLRVSGAVPVALAPQALLHPFFQQLQAGKSQNIVYY